MCPERREEEDEGGCGRPLLFFLAATAGFLFFVNNTGRIGLAKALLLGFAIMLLYPLVGAVVVEICASIRSFAFPQNTDPWDTFERLAIAAIWPVSLLYWLVVGPAFAVINRLFR